MRDKTKTLIRKIEKLNKSLTRRLDNCYQLEPASDEAIYEHQTNHELQEVEKFLSHQI